MLDFFSEIRRWIVVTPPSGSGGSGAGARADQKGGAESPSSAPSIVDLWAMRRLGLECSRVLGVWVAEDPESLPQRFLEVLPVLLALNAGAEVSVVGFRLSGARLDGYAWRPGRREELVFGQTYETFLVEDGCVCVLSSCTPVSSLCLSLPVCLSISLSASLYLCLSVSLNLSSLPCRLSVCLSVYLCVCLSLNLSSLPRRSVPSRRGVL